MSSFLRSTPFTLEFDGDRITARLKPLRQADALRVQSMKSGTQLIDGKERAVLDAQELLNLYIEIIPEYVEEFAGLRAADGSAISVAEVVASHYFTTVVYALGNAIYKTGQVPKPPDPKALASPRTGISTDSPSEAIPSATAA